MAILSRGWLRFRLKTLLALVTLFCIWLGWNARQYQIEFEVEQRLHAFPSEVYVEWTPPNWLIPIGAEWCPRIFQRIDSIEIPWPTLTDEQFASFHLDRLAALRMLSIDDRKIQGPCLEKLLAARPNLQFKITEFARDSIDVAVEAYLEKKTGHNRRQLLELLNEARQKPQLFENSGPRLGPRIGCLWIDVRGGLVQLMRKCNDEFGELAAMMLWQGHSFDHIEKVASYVEKHEPTSEAGRKLQQIVREALQPASIAAELASGDHNWGARLAAYTRHIDVLPALLLALSEKRATNETIVALGAFSDPRAYDALVQVLCSQDRSDKPGLAAIALATQFGAKAEKALLDALREADERCMYGICIALKEAGTSASLPELDRLAEIARDDLRCVRSEAIDAARAVRNRAAKSTEDSGRSFVPFKGAKLAP